MAPKRPTERQCMRDWLMDKLESEEFRGLRWRNRKEKIFSITWFHGSRHGWTEKESAVFEAWAIHTGRRDDSDARRWKANFRCAIKSLKDIHELVSSSVTKGQNACRIFKFLESPIPRKRASNRNSRSTESSGHSSGSLDKSPTHSHADSGIFDGSDETDDVSIFHKDDADFIKNENEVAVESVREQLAPGNTRCSTDPITIATRASPVPFAHTSTQAHYPSMAYQATGLGTESKPECHHYGNGVTVNDVTGCNISTSLPMFEKICPGITKIEFGKDHIIRRHLCGFRVELGSAAPVAMIEIPLTSSHSQSDMTSSMETLDNYDQSCDDDGSETSHDPEATSSADADLNFVQNEIIIYTS